MPKRDRWLAPSLLLAMSLSAGCGQRHPVAEPPRRLEVNVFADTGRSERLHIGLPAARLHGERDAKVWLTQVAPTRPDLIAAPLPTAEPAVVEDSGPAPPRLAIDPDLKPPILRAPGTLRIPPRSRRGFVELDVRVAEDGTVSDAIWAGGSSDSALTEAATECALAMRFYPALRAGKATAVWCRQRFDFSGRRD